MHATAERLEDFFRQEAFYEAARVAGEMIASGHDPPVLARFRSDVVVDALGAALANEAAGLEWFVSSGQSWSDDEIMLAIVRRGGIAAVQLAIAESGAPVAVDLIRLDEAFAEWLDSTEPRSSREAMKRWARDPIFACDRAEIGPLRARIRPGARRR